MPGGALVVNEPGNLKAPVSQVAERENYRTEKNRKSVHVIRGRDDEWEYADGECRRHVQVEETKDSDRAQHCDHDRNKSWMERVFSDESRSCRNKADEWQ